MMTHAQAFFGVLYALSLLVLDTNALNSVKPKQGAIDLENAPRVFVRGGNKKKGEPESRIMVWGSDLEDDVEDVVPRYHHIAKTGITSILKLLGSAVEMQKGKNSYPANMGAFQKNTHDFYIGSIRNPCDYYLSLWSYNVQQPNGQVRKELAAESDGDHYFKASESKNTDADKKLFREFVSHINGDTGVYTGRVAWGYVPEINLGTNFTTRGLPHEQCEDIEKRLKEFDESQVDCWVATESIREDVDVCLKLIADKGWPVDWKKYKETADNLFTNPSKHDNCKDYYDEPTEKIVRDKDDVIFDKFHFDKCCGEGSSLAAHLKHPDVHAPIKQ